MNIKDYLESGIVASYVLGLASEAEQKEFESLCATHPELIRAKKLFELALEAQLIGEAVDPPEDLREKISLSLKDGGGNYGQKNKYTPVVKMNAWKFVAAACLLILAGSIYFAYSINRKYEKLQNANIELKNNMNHAVFNDSTEVLRPLVKKPSVKWSTMLEPANPSHCMAHIFWDSLSTNTFLLIGNIPPPVSDKQFQLWAFSNEQPVNLGMFDIKKEGQLIQMKNVQNANKFVITVEQIGGSPNPTMQATYAIGKL